MKCFSCNKDYPDSEFPIVPGFNNSEYRSKRCASCREEFLNKKKDKIKQNISTCPKCKGKFPEEYGKNGRLFIKCPKCRVKHSKEQKTSVKSLYTKRVNKSTASILNDFNKIDKNKIMEIVANKIVEKLLNKI